MRAGSHHKIGPEIVDARQENGHFLKHNQHIHTYIRGVLLRDPPNWWWSFHFPLKPQKHGTLNKNDTPISLTQTKQAKCAHAPSCLPSNGARLRTSVSGRAERQYDLHPRATCKPTRPVQQPTPPLPLLAFWPLKYPQDKHVLTKDLQDTSQQADRVLTFYVHRPDWEP